MPKIKRCSFFCLTVYYLAVTMKALEDIFASFMQQIGRQVLQMLIVNLTLLLSQPADNIAITQI